MKRTSTILDRKDVENAIEDAIAQQRMEGLEPDAETLVQLQRVVEGEITFDDVLRSLHDRVRVGAFAVKDA